MQRRDREQSGRDISAQSVLLSTIVIGLALALVAAKLTGCVERAGAEAPAVAVQALGDGALLSWVTTHDADSVTITRCTNPRRCAFVDIVATAPGRPHTLHDADAQSGDAYFLRFYRARTGALDHVTDD